MHARLLVRLGLALALALAAVVVVIGAHVVAAATTTTTIVPLIDCNLEDTTSGFCYTYFGYTSTYATTQTIGVSFDNRATEANCAWDATICNTQNRGQETTFTQGTTHRSFMFKWRCAGSLASSGIVRAIGDAPPVTLTAHDVASTPVCTHTCIGEILGTAACGATPPPPPPPVAPFAPPSPSLGATSAPPNTTSAPSCAGACGHDGSAVFCVNATQPPRSPCEDTSCLVQNYADPNTTGTYVAWQREITLSDATHAAVWLPALDGDTQRRCTWRLYEHLSDDVQAQIDDYVAAHPATQGALTLAETIDTHECYTSAVAPSSCTAGFPLVFLVHDQAGTTIDQHELATFVARRGFVVVALEFRAFSMRGAATTATTDVAAAAASAAAAIARALDELPTLVADYTLATTKLGLVGQGFGASLLESIARVTPHVRWLGALGNSTGVVVDDASSSSSSPCSRLFVASLRDDARLVNGGGFDVVVQSAYDAAPQPKRLVALGNNFGHFATSDHCKGDLQASLLALLSVPTITYAPTLVALLELVEIECPFAVDYTQAMVATRVTVVSALEETLRCALTARLYADQVASRRALGTTIVARHASHNDGAVDACCDACVRCHGDNSTCVDIATCERDLVALGVDTECLLERYVNCTSALPPPSSCEHDLDVCRAQLFNHTSAPCSYRGLLVDGTCLCLQGYTGLACEQCVAPCTVDAPSLPLGTECVNTTAQTAVCIAYSTDFWFYCLVDASDAAACLDKTLAACNYTATPNAVPSSAVYEPALNRTVALDCACQSDVQLGVTPSPSARRRLRSGASAASVSHSYVSAADAASAEDEAARKVLAASLLSDKTQRALRVKRSKGALASSAATRASSSFDWAIALSVAALLCGVE